MSRGRVPDLQAAQRAFARFCETIAALRDPEDGCPWDLQQDHRTLRTYMIEEAYEAADAMDAGEPKAVKEELGDVLLQVVLNAQVALDSGHYSIVDVVDGIDAKMRRRHPHVFGSEAEKAALTSAQVRANWDLIKAEEKGVAKPTGYFADAHKATPASRQAYEIGKKAAKIKFDWDDAGTVFTQVRSEVEELAAEFTAAKVSPEKVAEELGDVYFSLAQLCRHLKLDPELVAHDANRKFLRRFAALEALAATRGQDVRNASRDELEALWQAVKRAEPK